MSRIGKQPIPIPDKVNVAIKRNEVTVKGPRGELTQTFNPDIKIEEQDGELLVTRPTDMRHHRSLHGLTRALLSNMVVGVSEGFTKKLIISGVGYRAEMQGSDLKLFLGFSHDIVYPAPDGITFDVPKESRGTQIIIEGVDKQVLGQVAAEIRKLRPPEPYKGKGITYEGEVIRRKAGKSGKA